MNTSIHQTSRSMLVAVSIAAAMAALAGCDKRPVTTPSPSTDTTTAPMPPASAASR